MAREQSVKPDTSRSAASEITVEARPLHGFDKLNSARTSFGALEWIGGLVLTSPDSRFGGFSGVALDKDGKRLVAVSDAGSWMTADLAYRDGKPEGLKNVLIGPLKAKDGGPLRKDRDRDAEAVLLLSGSLEKGRLLISFEQNHRLGLFDIAQGRVAAPSQYMSVPAEAKRMRALKGFEAVAEVQNGKWKGALLAFAEHLPDARGHHSGWIMAQGKSSRLAMTDIGGFDPTDAVGLSNGDVLVLERRFRWFEGVKMRLRRISASEIAPGGVIKGETLLEADMSSEIDNMEALGLHRAADGGTILTLMSDDNFNGLLQRTILLQFRLKDRDDARETMR